jgi:hypothetical protein
LNNFIFDASNSFYSKKFDVLLNKAECDSLRSSTRLKREGDETIASLPLRLEGEAVYYTFHYDRNFKIGYAGASCAVEASFANIEFFIDESKRHYYDTVGVYGEDTDSAHTEGATHLLDSIRTSTLNQYCPGFVEYYENRASGVLSDNARGL